MLLVHIMVLLTILIVPNYSSPAFDRHEVKPKNAKRLCGDDFIAAWKLVCKIKEGYSGYKRTRRNLAGS